MIVLDTNVLSEVLKPTPSAIVLRWLANQEPTSIVTTAVTQAEVFYGIEALPAGKRRQSLLDAVEKLFSASFEGRVLPFERDYARVFAKIVNDRESKSRPISQFDAMIAAICCSRGATLATRDRDDFENCGVRIVNPWDE